MEQEAAILRQRTLDLETENEKLTNENRRLSLRVSRKGPATAQEQLAIENVELKERIEKLEKQIIGMQPAEGEPVENPAVMALKTQVRTLEEEAATLHTKVDEISKAKEKLEAQLKVLRNESGYQQRVIKK